MKKIVLSALTTLLVGTIGASANTTFYVDENNQVFTKPATGRVALNIESTTKKKKSITIIDQKSPNFLLGKQTHINMKFIADDNPDMWFKAGVRIQGTFENKKVDYADSTKTDTRVSDGYLRRTRFEAAAGFNKWTSFVMDIRNDKVNFGDKGEQTFNVGDAYVKIKKPFGSSLVNFKLYRTKIDVSRTETVKSARVLHYDRPQVADEAAQYITHNRRGSNIQVYGNWNKKIHYQFATGDGVYSGKMKDASGATFNGSNVVQTNFFYGGKVFISPFDGWEETKRTETYFGKGKHFEIGASYWKSPDIKGGDATALLQEIDHELLNLELSAHYKGLFVQAEYFKFDGVVKAWGNAETGKSNGWYATGEYVIEELNYFAPFARYESWDKFEGSDGYDFKSLMLGANWYLKGNTIKAGLTYQKDEYGTSLKSGERDESRIKLTTQFFF